MRRKAVLLFALTILGTWQFVGCRSQLFQMTTEFELGEALGTFEVEAGVPLTNKGTGSFGESGVTIGSGSVKLDPSAITVTPADDGGSKGAINLQEASELVVTVWIAGIELIDTVCDVGERYGPYTVTLDENYVPVSVSPSTVTLSQSTIDLLNLGEFSLCIEVVSPVDGTVTIDSLTLRLGL